MQTSGGWQPERGRGSIGPLWVGAEAAGLPGQWKWEVKRNLAWNWTQLAIDAGNSKLIWAAI